MAPGFPNHPLSGVVGRVGRVESAFNVDRHSTGDSRSVPARLPAGLGYVASVYFLQSPHFRGLSDSPGASFDNRVCTAACYGPMGFAHIEPYLHCPHPGGVTAISRGLRNEATTPPVDE